MSYLTDLVERALNPGGGLRPRIPSLFEADAPAIETAPAAPSRQLTPRASLAGEAAEEAPDGAPREKEKRLRHAETSAVAPASPRHSARRPSSARDDSAQEPPAGREPSPDAPRPAADRASPERDAPAPFLRRRGAPATTDLAAPAHPGSAPRGSTEIQDGTRRMRVERAAGRPRAADVAAIAAAAAPAALTGGSVAPRPRLRREAPQPPPVRVTIGRIDVRTPERPDPVPEPAPRRAGPEPLRLEDYLRQRDAGER